MENSELYLLFKTLSNTELNELDVFIQKEVAYGKGRYREQLSLLYRYLRHHLAHSEAEPIARQDLFRVIFSEQNIAETQLVRVMHELLQLLRQFLLTMQYFSAENETKRQLDYAAILMVKGVRPKALNQINQTQKVLQEATAKGHKFYELGFELALKRYQYNSHNAHWKDDLEIPEAIKSLDYYYYSHRFLMVNHYLLFNRFSKMKNAELPMQLHLNMDVLPSYIGSEPMLLIYQKIYALLSSVTFTKTDFDELLNLITQYEAVLDQDVIKNFYSFLRNYLTFLHNAGSNDVIYFLHKLNLESLKKGYLFYNGNLAQGVYLNLGTTAIRANELAWALPFITEYRTKCMGDQEEADIAYHLLIAKYHHRKKEYTKALQYLPTTSPNLVRSLDIKTVEILCYFDMGDDLFLYKLDAFKMHLSRGGKNLISASTKEFYNNFINILLQISNTAPNDRERANKIITRIKSKSMLAEREWLMQKVEELIRP